MADIQPVELRSVYNLHFGSKGVLRSQKVFIVSNLIYN